MCFLKSQLAVTLPLWLFSELVRSLTVPEDMESIYLRTKGVKFAGSCQQQHLSQHRLWSCASNSKDSVLS